jgi:hypothetical protein
LSTKKSQNLRMKASPTRIRGVDAVVLPLALARLQPVLAPDRKHDQVDGFMPTGVMTP